MIVPWRSSSWRIRLLALVLAVILPGCAGRRPSGQPTTEGADGRIAFYRERLGGPGTYPAYARLGLALLQKYRDTGQARFYAESLQRFRQSLDFQSNLEALRGMAMALSERHEFHEALSYANGAVAALPGDLEALGILFDIRLALGDAAKAEDTLKVMLQAKPAFLVFSRVAALRQYRGDLAGAVEAMELACRAPDASNQPATTRAWGQVRLGSILLRQCRVPDARKAYDRALEILPGYFFAREHLAEWHAAQGEWREAGSLYRELLATHPTSAYRLDWGECCRRLGDSPGAARETSRALVEMRQAAAQGAQDQARPLALLLLETDDSAAEGLEWARRDWTLRQDALAADTLAWAHARNGHRAEAMQLSETALRTGNKSPVILLHAGMIRLQSDHVAEGQHLIEQVLTCRTALTPREIALAEEAERELSRVREPCAGA